jgi:hypothetical protein
MKIFDQLNHADALTWGALMLAPGACLVAAVLAVVAFRNRSPLRAVSVGSCLALALALVGVGLGALSALRAEAQRVNHLEFRPDLAPFADQLVQRANELMAWSGIFGAAAAVLAIVALLRTRQAGPGRVGARTVFLWAGAVSAMAAIALVGAGVWALTSASASVAGSLEVLPPDQRAALLSTTPAYALQQCAAWIEWAVPTSGFAALLLGWSFAPGR